MHIPKQPEASEEIKLARKEVLDWERDNRTSLNRASLDGMCCWQATDTSPGCAVGRLCTPEQQAGLAGMTNGDDPVHFLPAHVVRLGRPFLHHLQNLHDCPENWTDKGLSKMGTRNWDALYKAFV